MGTTTQNLAVTAYSAYCQQAGGKTFDGKPLPTFEELGEDRQQCWFAATAAVQTAIAEALV